MDKEKQLGVFWGSDGLYFVEHEITAPKKIFSFPFDESGKEGVKKGPLSTVGIGLVAAIKSIVKEQGLTDASVNLSLPTKDIIFRSFVIPWMQNHEVKNVVEFEAGKYIPFSLEKLSYSFHPTFITENDTKRIRIIFVAIKSDTLRSYTQFLTGASLNVNSIEPSASSLIRALSSKNLIPKDQTVALVGKEDVGRIIVIDNEIPQFVREFHIAPIATAQPGEEDPESEIKKMASEVRISLDYFNRQSEQLQVKQIFLLSASKLEELSETLEKTLSIPIATIDHRSILKDEAQTNLGFLNAYGTSIIPSIDPSLHFDFSKHKPEPSKPKVPIPKKPIKYKSLITTALVCISLIVLSIITSGLWTQKLKKDIGAMGQKLGAFREIDISIIEKKQIMLGAKLNHYKNIRMRSDTASLLIHITELLPEGTWIRNIDIMYDNSAETAATDTTKQPRKKASKRIKTDSIPALKVTIRGYAYSEDRNEQFLLVNRLLKNLKKSEEFSSFFTNINLETTEAQKLFQVEHAMDSTEYSITSFHIVCTLNNEPDKKTE